MTIMRIALALLLWCTSAVAQYEDELGKPPTCMPLSPREGSTIRFGLGGFHAPGGGPMVDIGTLDCVFHDLATGTELYDPDPWTVDAKQFKVLLPVSVSQIVRSGFCSATTAQVCSAYTGGCPAGETCQFVTVERHIATCEWSLSGGAIGTWEIPIDVCALRFYPFEVYTATPTVTDTPTATATETPP
jgi:hypothetical protein